MTYSMAAMVMIPLMVAYIMILSTVMWAMTNYGVEMETINSPAEMDLTVYGVEMETINSSAEQKVTYWLVDTDTMKIDAGSGNDVIYIESPQG